MDQIKTGAFLKELRREKGITQEQLAEELGVSGRTISRWETGNNMPDISLLVEIAEYFDVSIPEIIKGEREREDMKEEVKEVAETMSDYATTEKENIYKEMRVQSIIGLCALILYCVLHETGAYLHNDVLGKISIYCETLVFVSVIFTAAYTTGALAKLRSRRRKISVLENLPRPVHLIASAIVAFVAAVIIKKILVYIFGL